MEFSRQEYWSGLLFPTPGDLPEQGVEPESPALADGFFTTSATWEALYDPAILLLGSFPKRNENMLTQWPAFKYSADVFLIDARRNNPVIQQLVYRWKENKSVYLYTGKLHHNKKRKVTTNACKSKDASHLCKWEKPDTEGYILHDSCQWISGNGTTLCTEMYLWLPGYRSGGRSLMANSPREHFWKLRRFLPFYCGSIYTTVYICQKSTNGNTIKCWLLLYINYTTILFLKEKEILSI